MPLSILIELRLCRTEVDEHVSKLMGHIKVSGEVLEAKDSGSAFTCASLAHSNLCERDRRAWGRASIKNYVCTHCGLLL